MLSGQLLPGLSGRTCIRMPRGHVVRGWLILNVECGVRSVYRRLLPFCRQHHGYLLPVRCGLLLRVPFGRHHTNTLPRRLLLLSWHGLRNTEHKLPRGNIQRWWHFVHAGVILHQLPPGLMPRYGQHHGHLESMRTRLLLRNGCCQHAAGGLPHGLLLPCRYQHSHAKPLPRGYVVRGRVDLHEHCIVHNVRCGLLRKRGQRGVAGQSLPRRKLLPDLHAADGMPRGLLLSFGHRAHVVSGWCDAQRCAQVSSRPIFRRRH